jgi:hypothetical protein
LRLLACRGAGDVRSWLVIPFPLQQIGSATFIFFIARTISFTAWAPRVSVLAPAIFFVYATHEPTQTIIAKVWQNLGLPGFGTVAFFLAVPAAVFPLTVAGYMLLRRTLPGLLPIMTGGR